MIFTFRVLSHVYAFNKINSFSDNAQFNLNNSIQPCRYSNSSQYSRSIYSKKHERIKDPKSRYQITKDFHSSSTINLLTSDSIQQGRGIIVQITKSPHAPHNLNNLIESKNEKRLDRIRSCSPILHGKFLYRNDQFNSPRTL